MKLLTVTAYFESHRGGVELVAGRLARELAARGLDVAWAAGAPTPPPAPEAGLTSIPLKVWNLTERRLGIPFPAPSPTAIAQIVEAVRASDAVLLHDCLYLTNVAAFLAARRFRKPVLLIQHIGEVPYRNPLLRGLMTLANWLVARPLLSKADQVAFISEIARRHFASVRFRRPPALIFNGVDTSVFTPSAGPAAKRAAQGALGLPGDRPVALFVGRFVEKKGLAYLEAAARQRPDLFWVLAGWGPIDPERWSLENVRVLRGLDHAALAHLYRAADVLVLPSTGEGFPLVVQEALACGLPVVCGAETVEADPAAAPYLQGVPLEPDDPAATAALIGKAIDDAAAQSPEQAQTRARFAAARYAWRATAERHLALLTAIMERRET